MLTLIVLLALVFQAVYWIGLAVGFRRVQKRQLDGPFASDLPLSVIVAARNEEENIPALLAALELQTYARFGVIVVDDGSTDGTAAVVEERARTWALSGGPTLRRIHVEGGAAEAAGLPRKKYALTRGIEAAQTARLVFTDADCRPPPMWLATMARYATRGGSDSDAVLVGYGPYRKQRGLLNAFVRYETFLSAFMAAAAVGLGRPFLAVGRNFSYPRRVFQRLGGFAHSAASLSGDDDLFIQEVARSGTAPVEFVLHPASFVPSQAPAFGGAWFRQKLRHTSAGRHYGRAVQSHLLAFHLSNLVLWAGVPALWIAAGSWWGAGFLAGRFLIQRAALRPAMRALETGDLTLAQPFLDGLYLLYNTLIAPLGSLLKPTRW